MNEPRLDVAVDEREARLEARRRRIVENEKTYREINETVRSHSDRVPLEGSLRIFCECGDRYCAEPLKVAREEYEGIREHERRFAVAPEHVFPEAERVLDRRETYWLVEKFEGLA